jgi:hypothetical protein
MDHTGKHDPDFGGTRSKNAKQSSDSEHAATSPRPMTGFFATLSPEQQEAALRYCGPEDLGEPKSVLVAAKQLIQR